MVERRERRRRDGTVYSVWRARWRDETGVERSKTFDRAADARAWEAKVRVMKRGGALAELDAGTETLAEFVEDGGSSTQDRTSSARRCARTRSCGTGTRSIVSVTCSCAS